MKFLFVCGTGSCRSPMAQAVATYLGHEAETAGVSEIAERINHNVMAVIGHRGLGDQMLSAPQHVRDRTSISLDMIIVSMGVAWDPERNEYRKISSMIQDTLGHDFQIHYDIELDTTMVDGSWTDETWASLPDYLRLSFDIEARLKRIIAAESQKRAKQEALALKAKELRASHRANGNSNKGANGSTSTNRPAKGIIHTMRMHRAATTLRKFKDQSSSPTMLKKAPTADPVLVVLGEELMNAFAYVQKRELENIDLEEEGGFNKCRTA